MKAVAPVLEDAAHRVLVRDWRASIWRRVRLFAVLVVLLTALGGYQLTYDVATSSNYVKSAQEVYNRLMGRMDENPNHPSL